MVPKLEPKSKSPDAVYKLFWVNELLLNVDRVEPLETISEPETELLSKTRPELRLSRSVSLKKFMLFVFKKL